MNKFDLDQSSRKDTWKVLWKELDDYYQNTGTLRVTPVLDQQKIKDWIQKYPLDQGIGAEAACMHVVAGMKAFTVHTSHPSYYGLFNPRANFPAILADTITATFNPQMAAWSHSPFAVEIEEHLIKQLAGKFGLDQADGVFATGGAEANQTAVLCALNEHFPQYSDRGLLNLRRRPLIYCSQEAHHSIVKAARSSGLGAESLRNIAVDANCKMEPDELQTTISKDLEDGHHPFMVIATAGTTGTGSIDPLAPISDIAKHFGMWLHVDAAYGGALAFSEKYSSFISGIEVCDSLTVDIHKWLSVPMGCSVFITSRPDILGRTFGTSTAYMPKEALSMKVIDPFTHSIQWSRRFTGLKLYLSLLTFGWGAYSDLIESTVDIGSFLRQRLHLQHWEVLNDTVLPIVCFKSTNGSKMPEDYVREILSSGEAWVSEYPVRGNAAIRACITNYKTSREDILNLVSLLDKIRNHQ